MKNVAIFFALTLCIGFVAAQECGDSTFCNGVSLSTIGGGCSANVDICGDSDSNTRDGCDEDSQTCSHTIIDTTIVGAACFSTCIPDCEGKECGEDGCGSFCSACPEGSGCSKFVCIAGASEGSCENPYPLSVTDTEATVITGDRVEITTTGDTSTSAHVWTPICNFLSASPELIYTFVIPDGATYGYDMQLSGYDTVIEIYEGTCGNLDFSVACNDDGTPPGDLGSHIWGTLTAGTYYLMVDGFSSVDFGEFLLTAVFIKDCEPQCDGNFCGDDTCGGTCGTCEDGSTCNLNDNRCYEDGCVSKCGTNFLRFCGEDGCGGSCGACDVEHEYCLGINIAAGDEISIERRGLQNVPESACTAFAVCDNFNPVCDESCGADQICGSDCLCYNSVKDLPDMIVVEEHMLNESYLHDLNVPATSCVLIEGCVPEPGLRRLLRFTSSILNQGHADFQPPDPKTRPDLYEYGQCHQHYHFQEFAEYELLDNDCNIVKQGSKFAYCMEDTVRGSDGADIPCEKKFDCGFQGIQHGW